MTQNYTSASTSFIQGVIQHSLRTIDPASRTLVVEFKDTQFQDSYINNSGPRSIFHFIYDLAHEHLRSHGHVFSSINLHFQKCKFSHLNYEHMGNKASIKIENGEIEQLNISMPYSQDEFIVEDTKIKSLRFGSSTLEGLFSFKSTYIEKVSCNTPVNKMATFEKCVFGIKDSPYYTVDFNNAIFKTTTSFEGSTFLQAPVFFDTQLHTDTSFKGCTFPDKTSSYAWRAYRTLKQFMMHKESDHEAMMFHSFELESRYNTELPSWSRILIDSSGPEKFSSYLLQGITNYGRNQWLPLFWLLWMAAVFYWIYGLYGGLVCNTDPHTLIGWVKNVCDGNLIALYSLRNALGPLGLILNNDAIVPQSVAVKLYGLLHLILSSAVWFLWILQIRSRFKI